jgi:putative alpha-1,2-mannosidase
MALLIAQPYLYTFAGMPHKAQEWIYTIGSNEYNHTAGGLSGNEDCGQMSAWYIFSALGFYPGTSSSASNRSCLLTATIKQSIQRRQHT